MNSRSEEMDLNDKSVSKVKLPAASRAASHSIRSTGGMEVSFQNRGVSRRAPQRSGQEGRPGNLFSRPRPKGQGILAWVRNGETKRGPAVYHGAPSEKANHALLFKYRSKGQIPKDAVADRGTVPHSPSYN